MGSDEEPAVDVTVPALIGDLRRLRVRSIDAIDRRPSLAIPILRSLVGADYRPSAAAVRFLLTKAIDGHAPECGIRDQAAARAARTLFGLSATSGTPDLWRRDAAKIIDERKYFRGRVFDKERWRHEGETDVLRILATEILARQASTDPRAHDTSETLNRDGDADRPWMAPRLGAIVSRKHLETRLEQALSNSEGEVDGFIALVGLGGIGKTTLASWACQRPSVKHRFAGGLLWMTVGTGTRRPRFGRAHQRSKLHRCGLKTGDR